MKKSEIKAILRENIFSKLKEAEPKGETKEAPKAPAEKDGGSNKSYEKNYAEVQRKLSGTMLKQNQIMAAAGLGKPDDATDRSLFSKKVNKEKNEEGGQYLFNDEELASVIKVINNPTAYLNVKK
jgi:hypothetical protein